MIHRERVADDVYTFQSDVYAQVNAGAVIGQEWAVVIDTLAFPDETLAIREFIEEELKRKVRYVINTHYHADHSWGNCFFPGAYVLSHSLCRANLEKFGEGSLTAAPPNKIRLFPQISIVFSLRYSPGKSSFSASSTIF